MAERKDGQKLSPIQQAEVHFLRLIKNGGLTLTEALQLEEDDPELSSLLGSGIGTVDLINKFQGLGFIKYEGETGKFTAAELEENPSQVI